MTSEDILNMAAGPPEMIEMSDNVETKRNGRSWDYTWASLRLVLGAIFLWAFVDKLFGLNYSTKPANAWLNGGSPTRGFLGGTKGWLSGFFHAIAGNVVTDMLFMAGLLCVGLALVLGVGMRVAGYSGALMMLLMYAAAVPGVPAISNPLVDDHVVYAIVFVGIALHPEVGDTIGLGKVWHRMGFVKKHPSLA
jgi:thiosulfate dehydrogenase [quinone] large subunit